MLQLMGSLLGFSMQFVMKLCTKLVHSPAEYTRTSKESNTHGQGEFSQRGISPESVDLVTIPRPAKVKRSECVNDSHVCIGSLEINFKCQKIDPQKHSRE